MQVPEYTVHSLEESMGEMGIAAILIQNVVVAALALVNDLAILVGENTNTNLGTRVGANRISIKCGLAVISWIKDKQLALEEVSSSLNGSVSLHVGKLSHSAAQESQSAVANLQPPSRQARAYIYAYSLYQSKHDAADDNTPTTLMLPLIERLVKLFKTHRAAIDFNSGFVNAIVPMFERGVFVTSEGTGMKQHQKNERVEWSMNYYFYGLILIVN